MSPILSYTFPWPPIFSPLHGQAQGPALHIFFALLPRKHASRGSAGHLQLQNTLICAFIRPDSGWGLVPRSRYAGNRPRSGKAPRPCAPLRRASAFSKHTRYKLDIVTNPRLAVIILTSTFPRWDGDTDPPFVFDLAQRLSRACDIEVLCPSAPGTQQAEVFHGVRVRRFRYFFKRWETLAYAGGILNRFRQSRWYYGLVPFFMAGELLALMRSLRAGHADIINAHWLIPQGLVAMAARALTGSGAGLVCTLHGGDIFGLKGGLMTKLKRFVLGRCEHVNVVSSAVADAVAALGVEQQRIAVIPMGVDLSDRFIPGEAMRTPKSLLYVGRFAEKKGLAYLIDALPLVLKKHPDARLTIVGHGPLEAVLRARITGLGLSGAVTILGAVPNSELPAIYQRHEIVVFPSIVDNRGDTEGFGLVMVEAMGCGCAVIASDLPAIHDSIIEGETGLLAPQKNPAALAARIIQVLDDPALVRRLAAQGRAHVCSRFDWEMTAQKYAQVFETIVSQRTVL